MNTQIVSLLRRFLMLGLAVLASSQAQAQSSMTSGGWFVRGRGTNFQNYSLVIPLDGQRGVAAAPSLLNSYTNLAATNVYFLNATNTGSQSILTNRFAVSNAVAAFGSKYGGSPLYYNKSYRFGVYAGDFTGAASEAILVSVVNRTNGAWVDFYELPMPVPSNTNAWNTFVANGLSQTFTLGGLTTNAALTFTCYADWGLGDWGTTGYGSMVLTHVANSNAANCEYTVWVAGQSSNNWQVLNSSAQPFWSPMYTLAFDPPPPLQPNFVSQPQFSGAPLPPFYLGKSLTELLAVKTVVTNAVLNAATNWVDLDTSPELRDHPVLDQFVADMGSNALALASYVFNRIELTDAVTYNSNTNTLLDTSLNLGGINRSAYATFMEGQGSPTEQCALLIYLLRRAGVPACYIYGPTDGIQMLDSQLSALLRTQIHGSVNQNNGQVYTTNTLISVNYPWVAIFVGGQWIHLFPWLKDTEVTEGLNLYDYLPFGYNSGANWVTHYLTGDTNIFSLNNETDVPSTLFPLFVEQCLLTNAPGVSLDDIGTTAFNRQVEFTQWSDFPTPFVVTNGAVTTVHDLSTIVTNAGFASWTNIWDTISVRVFSSVATNKSLYTGDLRMCDLQDRKFLVRQQTNGSSYTVTLSLAPYRPTATNLSAFTNDVSLTNQQTLQMTLASTDDPINITFNRKRHRLEPAGITNFNYWSSYGGVHEITQITNTSSIRLGDLAAICLHSGRVSQQMLTPWAQEYWAMQQQVAANPSLTNTLSPDITQGTLPYLMGMSYYERCSRFQGYLAQLHKVQLGTIVGQGLSTLGAQRTTNGTIVKPLNLYHPHVDMYEAVVTYFGNGGLRMDEAGDPYQTADSFFRLFVTEASAQEHKITEDFYGQNDGISSVRLLRQAGAGNIVELTTDNFLSFGPTLSAYDPNMWQQVEFAFLSPFNYIANVYITLHPVTNSVVGYVGMGCLIYAPGTYAALISNNGLPANGGWGEPFDDPIYSPPDYSYIDLSFNTSFDDNWSVSYYAPTILDPAPLAETVSTWSQPTTYNDLSSGAITYGGVDVVQQNAFDFATFSLGYTGSGAPAAAYADAVNNGGDYDAHVGIQYAQLAGTVADPVNTVTGEFYIDATDFSLPGPMPLFIRRNYSSQDVDLGDSPFGYGWRPAYTPYLRVVTNNVIYAAELDGTVVAYRQPVSGTNYWKPTPADNPQLNNRSASGIGSTANLFNNYITTNTTGGTNFVLTGADGSVRLFQYASYPISGTTNTFNRTRPYLQTWTDAKGNSYTFSYQTDSTQPDYGQMLRVQSSNGNFFGFYYDVYAHITQAYTGDGRRLYYDYDSHGDLVTVTLPDASQINYTYVHTNTVTNIVSGGVTNSVTNFYSTHLIAQEQKPNGRVVANTYDALRRVIAQAATVGTNLSLVTNATFLYSNNFTNLTNSVISGTTYITNVFGKVTTYQYTNNLITVILDALNQTNTQVWFSNTNDTGYYPHSLKSRTDKRGLNTGFQYDSSGNLAQVVFTGNLTGGTATNETATYSFTYTGHNLLSTSTDPATNQTAYYYTNSVYPMLPTAVVKLAGTTPVTSNQYFYTNVIQTVTNGAVRATNSAHGLLQRVIRGGVGTNDFLYNGEGFPTQLTRYTGNSDPAVTTTFLYSERDELIQMTDPLGRSVRFAYDGMGRVIEQEVYEAGATTPEGFNYSYYNENGDLVWTDGSRYNPEDYVWRDYDGAGRKITEMHWRSEANPNGGGVRAPSATTNQYATTFYQYDAFNNLTQVTDPLGNYSVKSYDAIGQLTNEVAYSAAGTAMATNRYGYEKGGLMSAMTNALGGVTTKTYTSTGKPMFQSNPDGSTNGWQYYLDGRVNKEFLRNGNYWQTIYDDAHLTTTRYFHNGTTTLTTNVLVMDTLGNVIQRVDADGYVFTNLFDGLSRIKIAAGPPEVTVANVGLLPFTNFVTNVFQQFVVYFYDAAGQTLTTSNALGETTVTTRDALGRPTQVAIYNSNSTTPVRVTSTFYSADHQSMTVSNGTGSSAIVTTYYTDNDGHPLLSLGSPTNGVTEFTWWQYDVAGNRIAQQQCSSNASGVTIWATNGWTYDGLNRVLSETSRDGATTIYSRDAMGNVTNRAMSGVLTWSATYLSDGRIFTEQESGGSLTARSTTYSYYAAGNPFAGMLQSVTDGRGTTNTTSYDDFMRLATNTTTGSLSQQQTLTVYQYDPRGSLLGLSQSFGSTNTGPTTYISRSYDAYGQIGMEAVSTGTGLVSSIGQGFDAAGRRTQLASTTGRSVGTPFNYQADGNMIASDGSTFGYANNGLIVGRTNSSRSYVINQRDGRGRILSSTTTAIVGGSTPLTESLNWRSDGRLTNYVAVRADFTDTRNFTYSAYAQRLTQESFNLTNSQSLTNIYAIDNGATGGLGILTSQTQSGTQSDNWSVPSTGGLDGISRVVQSQNTIITRPAYGTAVGAATVSATLDGKQVTVQFDGPFSPDGNWRANLSLFPGSHTLSVYAVDLSGQFSASTNRSFTANGGATDTVTNSYDGNGNVTQRVWVSSLGVTNKIQTMIWDAFNRLIQVTDRDTNSSGFNFVSVFDGLGRRIRTIQTVVTNGVAITNVAAVSTVDSWYDPQVEFLEMAVNANNVVTTKTYGPDASGVYGGMQGVGGLETQYTDGHTTGHGSVQDYFGNVLASISNSVVTWNPGRYSSYGPVPGYQPPLLSLDGTTFAQTLGWRGLRMDPTGDYHLGSRRYGPTEGRFLSADPMGHSGSKDLYSFCGGDPVNAFDPTGRYGKQMGDASSYDGLANMVDYVGARNFDSWGIPDPLPSADFVTAYQQTEAGIQSLLMQGYNEVGVPSDSSGGNWFSSFLNSVPLIGALKLYVEQGWTGTDLITGNRVDQMSAWGEIAGVGLNLLSAYPFVGGMMAEAAQGARFAEGYANWQTGNVLSWQTGEGQWYGSIYEDTLAKVGTLDFSTPANQALFYSGPGNRGFAMDLAAKTGAFTIDTTPGGIYLNSLHLYDVLPQTQADAIWALASQAYANGASGTINAYVLGASTTRTYFSVELPLLIQNPNVTTINHWYGR